MNIFGLGVPELILIIVLVLLLFGGKKLPQLSKNVSSAIKDLRRGFSGDVDEEIMDVENTKTSSKNKSNK
ncbi:MAG: twin-arginine translocase TatA/TatE family subunit [Candidatus Saccharimonadales bacterium]